ncbi:ankyrin repeat protein, partial [Wilcoxina mikolae CBS 423.85]
GQNGASYICNEGHHEVVELLLSHNAHADATDNSGSTPLHLAVFGGHGTVVKKLLERKVNTEAHEVNGDTALHLAIRKGRDEVVQFLLDRGA